METWFVVLFLVEFLPDYMSRLGANADLLLHSGKCLVDFLRTLRGLPDVLTEEHRSQLMDIWVGFMRASAPLEIDLPKTHLMFHLIIRSVEQGNPIVYHTFLDEGNNRVLKRTARLCHQRNFEVALMAKLHEQLRRRSTRRRVA